MTKAGGGNSGGGGGGESGGSRHCQRMNIVSGQMNSCCPNREGENTRNAVCVREFTFWLQFINDKNETSYKCYFCVSQLSVSDSSSQNVSTSPCEGKKKGPTQI